MWQDFQFSNLIATLYDHQIILNTIAEALFNKDLLINHVSPIQLFGKEISVNINELFTYSNQLKYSA